MVHLEKNAQLTITNKVQMRLWTGSVTKVKKSLGGDIQQAIPVMGMLLPSIYCQLPTQPIHQLPLNFLQSIWEKKYKLLTSADWNITEILEVQNSLIGNVLAMPRYFLCTSLISTLNPCRQITSKNMNIVASRLDRLGDECRQKAWYNADPLLGLVSTRWINAIIDPSNYVPYSLLIVMGLSDRHTIFSDILTAMNSDMPEPSPYPFCSISSNRITMNPDAVSWMIISIALPIPIYDTEPYAPDQVYAKAYPNAIIIASSFCEPQYNLAYCGLCRSSETMPVPISSCSIHPADTTGESPSYMSVPLLDASITLIQQKGSLPSDLSTPQMGIWQQTRQMKRVMAVYSIFYRLLTQRLGLSMKGKRLTAGSRQCSMRNPIDHSIIYMIW